MISCSGTPFEIGYTHGEKAADKVQHSLQTYEKMFHENSGMDWKGAQEKALLHVREIEKFNSNYIEEMEGVAKGSGVTFEDILTLNTRSEIALVTTPDGCTSFALGKPVTNQTWLAQNWDWRGSQLNALVHISIEQKDVPSFQMITEAGIIGKIGLNEAGIGVCLNALVTDVWEPKVPIHFGLRAILEANSMEEALERVDNNQMASAAHFLIASSTGEIASAEVSPVYTAIRNADKGVMTHTNHICSAPMKTHMTEDPLENSFIRLSTIDQLLENMKDKEITKKDLFELLSSHDNYPDSICRHHIPENTGRAQTETVFSIVMNLSSRVLHWFEGQPCEHLSKIS